MQKGYQLSLPELTSSFVMAGYDPKTLRGGDLEKVKNILASKFQKRFHGNDKLKNSTMVIIRKSQSAVNLYQGIFDMHWAATTKTFSNGKRVY
jgi:hypothetical protein